MTQIILLISLIVLILINLYLVINIKNKINLLTTIVQTTLDKYILVVRSLGVAEGNVQGIAEQVEKQKEIDKGLIKEVGTQEITGVVKGTIKKI